MAVLAMSAAVGTADTAKRTDPKNDLKGVPSGEGFDFRTASVKHDGRKLVHRVVSWYGDRMAFPVVRLELQTGARARADWYVKKAPGGAAIFNAYNDEKVGKAKFIEHSGKAFSLKFGLGALGNPPFYAWRWRIVGPDGKVIDVIPNKGFVRHIVAG